MRRIKAIFILFILALVLTPTQAQHTKSLSFKIPVTRSETIYIIQTEYPTTGLVASISPENSFKGAFLMVESDTLWLKKDEHSDEHSGKQFSSLQTFSKAINSFHFSPGSITEDITFIFIDARLPGEIPAKKLTKKKSLDCSEPGMIDQSEWRIGLPDPDYIRIPNTVHNLIIHHTAGSNTDDYYIQVVRNIYIYHTEVRGWSDIGYNYLIAQDGTIFKGRDPSEYEQDNVLGAHFCKSNTGTMGVSMLGNYSDITPPDTAIQSLIALLNWKAGKDSLDPVGEYPHPLNNILPVIAGHRDGCATECPGTRLYEKLSEIRNRTMNAFLACNYFIKPLPSLIDSREPENIVIHQHYNELTLKSNAEFEIELYSIMGQKIKFEENRLSPNERKIRPVVSTPCTIILHVQGRDASFARLFFIP